MEEEESGTQERIATHSWRKRERNKVLWILLLKLKKNCFKNDKKDL